MAFTATLWLGMLLGVSFLATPVKFHAPSLTLATALEVGRDTFALFAKVEWGFLLFLLLSSLPARPPLGLRIALLLLAAIQVFESFWLLPILDARANTVIAGGEALTTGHHSVYVAAEFAKALLLFVIAVRALGRRS